MNQLLRRGPWRRFSLLDRWLLIELLGPLLFFVALFTLLLLTGCVMFELVRRLVEIELGSNATDAQVILSLERRASLEISVVVTLVLVAVIAWCGLRQ